MNLEQMIHVILSHYKIENQLEKCREELKELSDAIEEYKQRKVEINKQHIIEEIADVEIMLYQVKEGLGISSRDVRDWMAYKVLRQMDRIASES